MAFDHNAVESAVKYFFDHWYRGLKPSLNLETFPNGDVSIQMKVIIPAAVEKYENVSCNKQHRTKCSGKESRKRRKKRRQHLTSSSVNVSLSSQIFDNQNYSPKMESDDLPSLFGVPGASNFSPPSLVSPLATEVTTLTSNKDELYQKPTLQSTPTPSFTTRTILPSTPQHIGLDEVEKIMNQIRTNVGSSMEADVSRILEYQSGLRLCRLASPSS